MNIRCHSQTQQSTVHLIYHTVNKITYNLKWALVLKCCWRVLLELFSQCNITLDITIFNSAERDYECQILLSWVLFALRHKGNSLPNNIQVLLKSVLIDLCARNLVCAKPLCVHFACTLFTVCPIWWAQFSKKQDWSISRPKNVLNFFHRQTP